MPFEVSNKLRFFTGCNIRFCQVLIDSMQSNFKKKRIWINAINFIRAGGMKTMRKSQSQKKHVLFDESEITKKIFFVTWPHCNNWEISNNQIVICVNALLRRMFREFFLLRLNLSRGTDYCKYVNDVNCFFSFTSIEIE